MALQQNSLSLYGRILEAGACVWRACLDGKYEVHTDTDFDPKAQQDADRFTLVLYGPYGERYAYDVTITPRPEVKP